MSVYKREVVEHLKGNVVCPRCNGQSTPHLCGGMNCVKVKCCYLCNNENEVARHIAELYEDNVAKLNNEHWINHVAHPKVVRLWRNILQEYMDGK